jgi:hypothetical protein
VVWIWYYLVVVCVLVSEARGNLTQYPTASGCRRVAVPERAEGLRAARVCILAAVGWLSSVARGMLRSVSPHQSPACKRCQAGAVRGTAGQALPLLVQMWVFEIGMLWGAWGLDSGCGLFVPSACSAQRRGHALGLGRWLKIRHVLTGPHLQAALFAQACTVHACLVTLSFACLLALSAAEVLVPYAQQLPVPCCIRVHGRVPEGSSVYSSCCLGLPSRHVEEAAKRQVCIAGARGIHSVLGRGRPLILPLQAASEGLELLQCKALRMSRLRGWWSWGADCWYVHALLCSDDVTVNCT